MKGLSIKIKIILYVGLLLVIALSSSSVINDVTFKRNAVGLTEDAISRRCLIFVDAIEGTIGNMEVAANALAAAGTMVYENYRLNPSTDYRGLMAKFLTDYLVTDDNAMGYGLWFDKGIFPGDEYVGPYVFWGEEAVELTFDYEDPEYDFQSSEWYTTILPQDWNRSTPGKDFFLQNHSTTMCLA